MAQTEVTTVSPDRVVSRNVSRGTAMVIYQGHTYHVKYDHRVGGFVSNNQAKSYPPHARVFPDKNGTLGNPVILEKGGAIPVAKGRKLGLVFKL